MPLVIHPPQAEMGGGQVIRVSSLCHHQGPVACRAKAASPAGVVQQAANIEIARVTIVCLLASSIRPAARRQSASDQPS